MMRCSSSGDVFFSPRFTNGQRKRNYEVTHLADLLAVWLSASPFRVSSLSMSMSIVEFVALLGGEVLASLHCAGVLALLRMSVFDGSLDTTLHLQLGDAATVVYGEDQLV